MKVTAIVAVLLLAIGCGSAESTSGPTTTPPVTAPATPVPTRATTPAPTDGRSPDLTPSPRTTVPPVAGQPGVCAEADLLFDPTLNELLLVNCTTYSGGPRMLAIWGWNGSAWQVVSSGPAPARVVGGAALDTARDVLTVYGGYVPDTDPCSQETWVWDGAAWSQISGKMPPACDHLKMIYDPAAQLVLEVGGQDAHGVGVDQTWSWNGSTWQSVDAQLPPSRAHFGLQYDTANQRVVLYGGLTTTAVLGDFWEWRAGAWHELDAPQAGARSHLGMVYDTANDALYVYGGATSDDTYGSLTDDMWMLTNGQWHELHPATTPGARGSAAMGYDPERNQIVLYGGFDASGNELADTWLWDGNNWSCAANCP